MQNSRYIQLSQNILNNCLSIKANEIIYLETNDVPETFVLEFIKEAAKINATVFYNPKTATSHASLISGITEQSAKVSAHLTMEMFKNIHAYVRIDAPTDAPPPPEENLKLYLKAMRDPTNYRCSKLKWCVLSWPTPTLARESGTTLKELEDLYFKVCAYDHSKMIPGALELQKLLNKTDKVHIKGPGTDLTFSIKDVPSEICCGKFNMPDGEVFTAPVKNSVNGTIKFNAPTTYNSKPFNDISLTFENGKIVKATSSNDTEGLNAILDTDEGARYIGEFALGFNPLITNPMRDILFDEKIAGSFHITPGSCYDKASNGNSSAIHWDMVCLQDPSNGGGEIWFDGVLIRKDGLFIPEFLHGLNPNNLI